MMQPHATEAQRVGNNNTSAHATGAASPQSTGLLNDEYRQPGNNIKNEYQYFKQAYAGIMGNIKLLLAQLEEPRMHTIGPVMRHGNKKEPPQ